MLRQIFLHGWLGKKYGKEAIPVNADTTQEVMRGLISRFGAKFRQLVRDNDWHVVKGTKKHDKMLSLEESELAFGLGEFVELHLMPKIKGASGALRAIVGIVLIVVGAFTSWAGGSVLIQMGVSLLISGVAQMLAPKPNMSQPADQMGQQASFMFNGTVNVTEQGGPVPIIYGRVTRASSVVLSAGMDVANEQV